jgi:hypothetical protein
MVWVVQLDDMFEREVAALDKEVKRALLAGAKLLATFGPGLGRPHADTLKGSRHANMKELRFSAAGGVWRVAFAFDTRRQAILLVAGDKAGVSERRFYQRLIATADKRYTAHLERLRSANAQKGKI